MRKRWGAHEVRGTEDIHRYLIRLEAAILDGRKGIVIASPSFQRPSFPERLRIFTF
jgi:hypothetical protein